MSQWTFGVGGEPKRIIGQVEQQNEREALQLKRDGTNRGPAAQG